MPVTEFLSSMANKAQSALTGGSDPAGTDGSSRSNTLANIQHHLRTFQMQYSETIPVQRIITTQKGAVIDFDNAARDLKAQSKELYMWGQGELDDIKDVTDRLAYLNFVQGALASALATSLDSARLPLKALRDAETNLTPRRNIRAGIMTSIARVEHAKEKGMEKRLAELRAQLKKAELDDEPLEKDLEIQKRKALSESEEKKWAALREYGEKLILLSEASTSIITSLPSIPPTSTLPYTGAQTTANTRAALQRALDGYRPGHSDHLRVHLSASDLSRSESRSFGITHKDELLSINTTSLSVPGSNTGRMSPPTGRSDSLPISGTVSNDKARSPSLPPGQSSPLNPAVLNNAPASIPESAFSPVIAPVPLAVFGQESSTDLDSGLPTIAETGVPVSAGEDGPGPATGSLLDLKSSSSRGPGYGESAPQYASAGAQRFGLNDGPAPSSSGSGGYPSAEDEKKRLEREERERLLRHPSSYHGTSATGGNIGSGSTSGDYLSAEEEKKRLQREDRERILRGDQNNGLQLDDLPGPEGDDGDLPPYQDF